MSVNESGVGAVVQQQDDMIESCAFLPRQCFQTGSDTFFFIPDRNSDGEGRNERAECHKGIAPFARCYLNSLQNGKFRFPI